MNKVEKAVAALERCPHCGAEIEVYARSCAACGRDAVDQKLAAFKVLRRAGAVSEEAFDEVRRLLTEAEVEPTEPVKPSTIRKQVTELVPADLDRFPIWEFALDEEGEAGQDEETVRPRPDLDRADPTHAILIVRAEFVAADGTRFDGFVSPHDEPRVDYTQPTVVTDAGQVRFWFGLIPPRPDVLEVAYRTLGKSASELFPLRYRALVEHRGAQLAGELSGFLHYKSGQDHTVVEIR
jgi:zinc-ribbon domain